ncbi:hypothetical protein BC834DRAFT_468978 [Gloeopeniophorella convolvens]|nr:hypothetical protein BC834DRAFT_468978 [Gloeopeniophorella convolvens]
MSVLGLAPRCGLFPLATMFAPSPRYHTRRFQPERRGRSPLTVDDGAPGGLLREYPTKAAWQVHDGAVKAVWKPYSYSPPGGPAAMYVRTRLSPVAFRAITRTPINKPSEESSGDEIILYPRTPLAKSPVSTQPCEQLPVAPVPKSIRARRRSLRSTREQAEATFVERGERARSASTLDKPKENWTPPQGNDSLHIGPIPFPSHDGPRARLQDTVGSGSVRSASRGSRSRRVSSSRWRQLYLQSKRTPDAALFPPESTASQAPGGPDIDEEVVAETMRKLDGLSGKAGARLRLRETRQVRLSSAGSFAVSAEPRARSPLGHLNYGDREMARRGSPHVRGNGAEEAIDADNGSGGREESDSDMFSSSTSAEYTVNSVSSWNERVNRWSFVQDDRARFRAMMS